MEDENNFTFTLDGHEVFMEDGKLVVDNCEYEENKEDVVYSLARAYWRLITTNKD